MLVLVTCGGPFSPDTGLPRQRDPVRARRLGAARSASRAARHPATRVVIVAGHVRRHEHLARARSSVARHHRRGRASRGRPARLRARSRGGVLVRDLRRLPAAGRLDSREARRGAGPGDRHQRLDAGRRLPLPAAGRARRPRGGRGPELRPHAPGAPEPRRRHPRDPARAGRDRRGRAREGARGRARARGSPTSSRTSRTRPAARCRWTSAGACSSWRPSTTSRSSRTTRTWSCASRARTSRRCCRSTSTAASSTRRRSRRRCAPGSAWATWSGSRRHDRRDPQARHEHVHLAEHGRPGDRGRVLRVGRDRRLDRDGQGSAARASRRDRGRARAPPARTPAS